MNNQKPSPKADSFRCSHGHNGFEHKACYIKFLEKEYLNEVAYLDIETNGLNANFGTMFCWSLKPYGKPTITDRVNAQDYKNKTYDKRIVSSLIKELKNHKVIVTYYGSNFDVPFIRTRAMKHNLPFPFYRELMHHDLYYVVRSKMKLDSNRLANVCEFLGVVGKTPLKKDLWIRAQYGDMDAIGYILAHNIGDVKILEKVHERLIPYMAGTRRSI